MPVDQHLLPKIAEIAGLLRRQPAPSVLFITGAGISADSGLPTYRGIGGLYDIDLTEDGLPIEEVLSGDMYRRRPELTWKYLAEIERSARGATFNRGHQVIVEIERALPRVWTLTQNVDGFHRLAGSNQLIEIHGNMRSLTCLSCDDDIQVDSLEEYEVPPRCRHCQSILRPNVVLFGEMLPDEAIGTLERECSLGFDLVFSIGTSSFFPYIAGPVQAASRSGIPTIEINPADTIVSSMVDFRLPIGAAEALDAIWTADA